MRPIDHYRFFDKNYKSLPNKLGWWTQEGQDKRFAMVIQDVEFRTPLRGLTVHDAGCGHASLLKCLEERGVRREDYTGTDFYANALQIARRNVGPDVRLVQGDLLNGDIPTADVTVLIGVLAFYTPSEIQTILERCWAKTNKTMSFTVWPADPAYPQYLSIVEAHNSVKKFISVANPTNCLRRETMEKHMDLIFTLYK
jgi:SAM-dependent methyltransferase